MSGNEPIASWISQWRDLLERPLEILLGDHPFNVLIALEEVLTEWLSKRPPTKTTFDPTIVPGGLKENLVRRTCKAISVADPTFLLLDAVDPGETASFTQLVQSQPVDARLLLVPLRSLLSRIRGDLTHVTRLLAAELRDPARRRPEHLNTYSHVLARHLILNDDPRNLKKLPEEVLSREGIAAAQRAHLRTLWLDPALTSATSGEVQAAASAVAAGDLTPLIADGLNTERLGSQYGRIYTLTQALAHLLPSTAKIGDSLPNDDESLESFGRTCLVDLGRHAVRHALRVAGLRPRHGVPQLLPEYEAALQRLGNALFSLAASTRGVNPAIAADEWPYLHIAIEEGTESFVRHLLVAHAIKRFEALIPEQDALALGRELVTKLAEEVAGPGLSLDTPGNASQVLTAWAARPDVQLTISASAVQHVGLLGTALQEASAIAAASGTTPLWGLDGSSAWNEWLSRVASATRRWSDIWKVVDWSVLPHSALEGALDEIPATYATNDEYDVAFSVLGVDAQGERWTAARIHWYADSALALSDTKVPLADNHPPNRLRAWLRVRAPSSHAAILLAADTLEVALSALTYALSGSRSSGLRPLIERSLFSGNATRGGWREGGAWKREELFRDQTAREGGVKEFSITYAPLVERSRNPSAQSEIEQRLVRAFAWYREGRWEPNATSRFLAYFVAFEQIFVGGRTGQKFMLPRSAQGLIEPWIVTHGQEGAPLDAIVEHAQLLRRRALVSPWLATELDALPQLTAWRTDIRPLLVTSALTAVLARGQTIIPPHDADLQALQAFVTDLLAFKQSRLTIEADRERVRERWRFSLELLQLRRHEVAHEAWVGGPDMTLYALGIETVLEQVMGALASLTLNNEAGLQTVEEAIRWSRPPWLE